MLLRLRDIEKSFGATRAVAQASLEIAAGEIVAVIGENGAGKTTLLRIAAGELLPDAGTVERSGNVSVVHQHFLLVDELTIAENLALALARQRFFSRSMLEREAEEVIARSGIRLDGVSRRVEELSVGEKAKLELIKAVAHRPATLILDEPTAVLTPREAEELFDVVRRFAAEGTAVVFISHKIPEVMRVAQRIVVMRQGRVINEHAVSATSVQQLAAEMVHVAQEQPAAPRERAALAARPVALDHAGLRVHEGEIVAVAGVAGNGQSALAAALRQLYPDAGHIPEDRTRDGIVGAMSIAENLALRGGRWRGADAAGEARRVIDAYSVRASGPRQLAGELSGGNQQKVVLARELDRHPSLIVAAEPTRGLDVEASAFVHRQLRAAAAAGAAIVLITSDLDEAFLLADVIQVIDRGRLSEPMPPEVARARVADLMAGVS